MHPANKKILTKYFLKGFSYIFPPREIASYISAHYIISSYHIATIKTFWSVIFISQWSGYISYIHLHIAMPKVLPEYKEEAKKRIIEASVKVMSEKGYSQTTMEDIAAYLGVSKGALYLYFKSKDDIIVESAKKMQSHLLQLRMMQMAASPTKDPLDVWIKILDNFMPFDSKINTLYFELVAITQRDPEINKLSAKSRERDRNDRTRNSLAAADEISPH